jgi:aryl-alcohol dehydrogenase-like predicted oxidoreductase
MKLGIGGESLSSFLDKPEKLIEFCRIAHDNNYEFIDTSPFYHNALIDHALGKHVLPNVGLTVVSKGGLPYVDLRKISNRILTRFRKIDSKLRTQSLGWETGFNQRLLSIEITESLKRLKKESHDTYLLHSVPEEIDLDRFSTQLNVEKQLGRIRNIGLSVDKAKEGNFEWADVLQVPTSLRKSPMVMQFKGTIIFNGIFRENGSNAYTVLGELLENFPNQCLVIGSKNIEHLLEVSKIIKRN